MVSTHIGGYLLFGRIVGSDNDVLLCITMPPGIEYVFSRGNVLYIYNTW